MTQIDGPPPQDRSGRYLLFFAASTLVAAVGAALLPLTDQDELGAALLLVGDAAIIGSIVRYLRGPV